MVDQSVIVAGKTLYIGAHNVAIGAISASRVAGSVAALAGGGAAAKELAKAYYTEMKEELANPQVSRPKSSASPWATWETSVSGGEKEKLKELLLIDKSMTEEGIELLVFLGALVAGRYAVKKTQESQEKNGLASPGNDWIVKAALRDIKPCATNGCECGRFYQDPFIHTLYQCDICGHLEAEHKDPNLQSMSTAAGEMYWLLLSFAVEAYQDLENRDEGGILTTQTWEIKSCRAASCECEGFDLTNERWRWSEHSTCTSTMEGGGRDEGKVFDYCQCGHQDREHVRTGDLRFVVRNAIADAVGGDGSLNAPYDVCL